MKVLFIITAAFCFLSSDAQEQRLYSRCQKHFPAGYNSYKIPRDTSLVRLSLCDSGAVAYVFPKRNRFFVWNGRYWKSYIRSFKKKE